VFGFRNWDPEKAWKQNKPHPCVIYDTGNLTNEWPDGGEFKAGMGPDENNYIAPASAFYGARVYAGIEMVVQELAKTSGRGKTPISSLILIGHGRRNRDAIGGSQFGFTINTFGRGRERYNWPSWEDALAGHLPPICWIRTDAKVRFVGCETATFAKAFASAWLRGDAKAYGTTRGTWAFGPKALGWMTPSGGPDTTEKIANTPEEYHGHRFWQGFRSDGSPVP